MIFKLRNVNSDIYSPSWCSEAIGLSSMEHNRCFCPYKLISGDQNGLVTGLVQIFFFCVPQKKTVHTVFKRFLKILFGTFLFFFCPIRHLAVQGSSRRGPSFCSTKHSLKNERPTFQHLILSISSSGETVHKP